MSVKNKKACIKATVILILIIILIVNISKCERQNKSEKKEVLSSSFNLTVLTDNSNVESKNSSIDVNSFKTYLYYINDKTPYFAPDNSNQVFFDYADGSLDGLYSGMPSTEYNGYVKIDYGDGYVLVDENLCCCISTANIIPVGAISQLNSSYKGYSACGVASLYMLANSMNIDTSRFNNYDELLDFAEAGYADQGSLLNVGGGMTANKLTELARQSYGIELENVYIDTNAPSDTIKQLLDKGKQCIALVKSENHLINPKDGIPHFILISGYIQYGNDLYFVYADSNFTENFTQGSSLKTIKCTILDATIKSDFQEPNAILCTQ